MNARPWIAALAITGTLFAIGVAVAAPAWSAPVQHCTWDTAPNGYTSQDINNDSGTDLVMTVAPSTAAR